MWTRSSRLPVFLGIGRSVRGALQPKAIACYLLAALLTPPLVLTGWDTTVLRWFEQGAWLGGMSHRWTWWYLGSAWHVGLGFGLALAGALWRSRDLTAGGAAVLQALMLVFLVTIVLKTITGRHGSLITSEPGAFHLFELSFERVKMKWPSGHTSTAVATAASLGACFPGRRWLRLLLWGIVCLVAWTLLDGSFHWPSDIVAGALIAHPIGRSVGRTFRRCREAGKGTSKQPSRNGLEAMR